MAWERSFLSRLSPRIATKIFLHPDTKKSIPEQGKASRIFTFFSRDVAVLRFDPADEPAAGLLVVPGQRRRRHRAAVGFSVAMGGITGRFFSVTFLIVTGSCKSRIDIASFSTDFMKKNNSNFIMGQPAPISRPQ